MALDKTNAERFALVVPAERLMLVKLVATVTDPVIVDPLNPKLKLLEFDKTNADRFAEVVPAERLTFVKLVATVALAVMVEPVKPNETLLLFDRTTVPAETVRRFAPIAAGAVDCVYDPVIVDALIPNESPFEFASDTAPSVTVPPDAITDLIAG